MSSRFGNYFRANPGAGLVLVFEVILLIIIVLVLNGNPWFANEVATYAFYLLLAGIVVQLVVTLRADRRERAADEPVPQPGP